MENVCVLGSTGSIGKAALEVIHHLKDKLQVFAISCNKNILLFKEQVEFFNPKYACITDYDMAKKFKSMDKSWNGSLLIGTDGLCELASHPEVDIVLNALVGTIGIHPTLAGIRAKKRIAMANKETLIAYGELLMSEVEKNGTTLLPVDSEHSAIHQCISCSSAPVKRIILTASGGPFLNTPLSEDTTIEAALQHPVWEMGKKITIDSATLMNKGLEVIEAALLFHIPSQNIEVVIHPQSIIHSAVEFIDNSIITQLSLPDMHLPIQYALTYPMRYHSLVAPLDFVKISRLDFFPPDFKKFPCLKLAYEAATIGGSMTCVLNAANQVAVNAFLSGKIKLTGIPEIVEKVMSKHTVVKPVSLADIDEAERWAIEEAEGEVRHRCC